MFSIETIRQVHLVFLFAELAVFVGVMAVCVWRLESPVDRSVGWRRVVAAVLDLASPKRTSTRETAG